MSEEWKGETTGDARPARRRRRPVSYLRSGLYVKKPTLPAPNTPLGALLAERRAGLIRTSAASRARRSSRSPSLPSGSATLAKVWRGA